MGKQPDDDAPPEAAWPPRTTIPTPLKTTRFGPPKPGRKRRKKGVTKPIQ